MASQYCRECLLASITRQHRSASTSLTANLHRQGIFKQHPRWRLYTTRPSHEDTPLEPAAPNSTEPIASASSRPDSPSKHSKTTKQADTARDLALARWSAFRDSALQKFTKRQQELRQRLGVASTKINDVTGYKEIERLKEEVARRELELLEGRAAAKEAKEAHAAALNERMASGREVNDLLQRKNSWLDSDVLRFTELVRQDHLNEQKERDRKIDATREEEAVERKIGEMMQSILRRYHEEQVWSDKVRSLSTYGTLAITSINVLIFLLALILVEPWKRRRLVGEVEKRIKERDLENERRLGEELQDMKTLLSSTLGSSSLTVDGNAGIMSQNHNLFIQDPDASAPTLAHSSVSTFGDASRNADSLLEQDRSSSPDTTGPRHTSGEVQHRDLWYGGAGGTLFGAALVTAWASLFR